MHTQIMAFFLYTNLLCISAFPQKHSGVLLAILLFLCLSLLYFALLENTGLSCKKAQRTDSKISAADTAAQNEHLLEGLEIKRGNRNPKQSE